MRTQWKRRGHSRWCWKQCLGSWGRRLRANCASRRSASAPARTATGRFLSFTIFWVSRLARRRNLRASMRMLEKSFPNISMCNEELEMTPQEMRTLYDYNAWANHRSLEAASALTTEQFVKPMGSSFGSVRDTLAHIYGAEWIWLERFQYRSPAALPDTTQFKDVASLRERWSEHETRLLTFVRGLTQADLDRGVEYKTLKY